MHSTHATRPLRDQPVSVSYDRKGGGRATRTFPSMWEARRFYSRMVKQGRNPAVIRAEGGER